MKGRRSQPADTRYGWAPLSWVAEEGPEWLVKILLERNDIPIAAPDLKNQTLLPLALSQEHYEVVKIILDWDNSNSDAANRDGQTSLPPSTGSRGERVARVRYWARRILFPCLQIATSQPNHPERLNPLPPVP